MTERFCETAHFHGDGMFGYVFTSITRPRLSYKDTCYRKTRSTVREWRVDGAKVEPDQIVAALAVPPILSDEERAALAQITGDWVDLRDRLPYAVMLRLREKGVIEAEAGKVRLVVGQ